MRVTRGQLKSLSRAVELTAHALKEEAENLPDVIPGNDQTSVESTDANLGARIDKLEGLFAEVQRAMIALREGVDRSTVEDGAGTEEGPRDDAAAAAGPSEKLGFGEFLAEIGGAMLASQRALDAESLRYLAETHASPHVMPSVFRIPKLHAEMKFALEKGTEKGINLIFFKNQSLAKELHQQSLTFEMVAVPPPPDAWNRISAAAPGLRLILDRGDRETVLTAGARAIAADRLPAGVVADRVVILESSREPGSLVFYAAGNNVGLWLFAGGVFRSIYAFGDRNDGAEIFLRRLVSGLADGQQPLLARK